MNSIGVLDEKRLALIPSKHWKAHEFCFYLHDRLVQLLVEYESSGAHNWVTDTFQEILDEREDWDGEIDILNFMKEHKLVEPYKHHLISHLVLSLTSDMLHFMYEALSCFEKRKFTVGFALLRKPFKENLLFLSWLLGDQDDFIQRFEANNYQSLNGIKKEKQIAIIAEAIKKLAVSEMFDADLIWSMIYSKNHEAGFESVWQRATHLITSQGDLLKTEDYTINFIFESPADNHFFEMLYSKLPYLLMFSMQVVLECFSLVLKINEKTYSHQIVSTTGCYEALFLKNRPLKLARMLNKELKPFLKCIHCEAPLRIDKNNAPALYLSEHIQCKKCGLVSEFPLYWLFCVTNVSIIKK